MQSLARHLIIVACIMLVAGISDANAKACGNVSYSGERAKLERKMVVNSYSKAERSFLLSGADRRVRELKQNALNDRGRQCGIEAVRAHVLGCMAAQLPRVPDRKTGQSMWGKSNVTSREAVFIGTFHACRGGAVEAFLG